MISKKISYLSLVLLLLTGSLWADNFTRTVKKGNESFKKGDFKAALDYYHQAEVERPEMPGLLYNIGTALYKEGKLEEAADKLEKSFVTENVNDEAMGHYNLGNVQYKMGDYQKAIASYQKSLELVPDDLDAKYNLELARKMLKEQMKPEQQKDQNQQQQNQQQKQNKDQQKDEKNKDEQDKQDQQQKDQQQQQQQQQQVNKNEMSKEDAERILNAIKDDEKELQKDAKQVQVPAGVGGKDW
jgi:Ca-activated chloride channel family protein